jgi:hypothetical protein
MYGLTANAIRDLCDMIENAEWTTAPYGDGEVCPFCNAGGYDYLESGKHDEEHYEYCVFRHDRPSGQKRE